MLRGQLTFHEIAIVIRVEDRPIDVVPDKAIVTAHKASSGAWDGRAYAADEWISEVYVRRSGRWLCVLSQKCAAEG